MGTGPTSEMASLAKCSRPQRHCHWPRGAIFSNETTSDHKVDQQTTICNPSRLSVALKLQGFEKGNNIHIVTNNNIHYHSLLLAVWRLGGVTSCGDSALNAETIQYQVMQNMLQIQL